MPEDSGGSKGWLMAANNNQPSIGVQWPENNNPSRQANIKDLVGRVEEFVAFEAAAGAEEVDTMVPGVYGVNCHGLCACHTNRNKALLLFLSFGSCGWVLGGEIRILRPSVDHVWVNPFKG